MTSSQSGPMLPRVDPADRLSLPLRGYASFLGTAPGRWIAINVASKVDPWLLRVTRGRVGMGLMLPSTLLTTTGAKSGLPRTNAVLYFHDGPDVIVIAASYGRPAHPAWYYNLKAHPRVRIGTAGGGLELTATEVTDADERNRLWAMADRIYPLFADYRDRATHTNRTIPIIRLSDSSPSTRP
jgi:deazaflavin-dependent oxidoreductase (nitroreductase family)